MEVRLNSTGKSLKKHIIRYNILHSENETQNSKVQGLSKIYT